MGIDSWSDDFIAESHVGQLYDFWERFQIEKQIITDRFKSSKKKNSDDISEQKYAQVITQLNEREQVIKERVDIYIQKLIELTNQKKDQKVVLMELSVEDKFEILIMNENKLKDFYQNPES